MAHGTLAGYRRHKHAGNPACDECVAGARREWRAKARRRMELRREEVLATSRRSHARAVRCVVCGHVVPAVQLVGVEPARAPRDRVLPCHAQCARRVGRSVVATDPDPRSLRQPVAVGAGSVSARSIGPQSVSPQSVSPRSA